MATVPKQEFRIRDIPTRTVTLFPTRAQVVRDIKNVVLKPGANEITILGLSPSVDEDSIKVEGTGSAIISDISVELLPNRDIFEEVYPDSDDDESEESDDEPEHDQKKESEAMASLNDKLTALEDEQKRVKEIIASAESQVKILDSYGTSIKRENTDDIRADLKDYRNEREKAFKDHLDAAVEDRKLSKKITDLKLERASLARTEQKKQKQLDKEKVKAEKAKQKEAVKKARRKMEERKEKSRIRKEREDLWPVMCWSVRITLDAIDLQTPGLGSGSILKRLGRKSSTAEATLVSADNSGTFDFDSYITQEDAALPPPVPSLSFQESSPEETGLTTTYDLPGLKSLPSSSTPSKQRVARVSFTSVSFSHTVVPKYKPAAYLKAKLRNGSKITLLKGPVGLTLDGSFMGRSTLPRCSAGDSFTLSLGVDPAIDVAYSKPEVRRSTSGMIFSKEDSSVYTRTTTISNTRAAAAAGKSSVRLVVQDQVPVSEDERLRVAIHCPRGLVVGGNPVPAGTPGKPEDKDWGQGKATLKKAGEVEWDIELAAGKSVRLVLEYEVAAPGGEGVVQV
ncbi:hypothetical protein GE09DRAFT_620682 [Coniochaeta sp. 2T2.1]|nr:hypothetical protein GE09DRAFT_620682 [Coniochaeta sp. 2T2.1]